MKYLINLIKFHWNTFWAGNYEQLTPEHDEICGGCDCSNCVKLKKYNALAKKASKKLLELTK